ncbi:hypothetical protein [Aromatoleum toluclasticum]|uniref:hypothetical protein n=1 Tax=Aromatoleum toluclasticum TaxID=92003 RepID=UPI00036A7196|nr:hypothetical protein [Aromatoleum toluclasticum]
MTITLDEATTRAAFLASTTRTNMLRQARDGHMDHEAYAVLSALTFCGLLPESTAAAIRAEADAACQQFYSDALAELGVPRHTTEEA